MNRTETIEMITARLEALTDEQLAAIADMARAAAARPVYATLSDREKAEIEAALDRLDRGEGVPIENVRAKLDAKLRAAGV